MFNVIKKIDKFHFFVTYLVLLLFRGFFFFEYAAILGVILTIGLYFIGKSRGSGNGSVILSNKIILLFSLVLVSEIINLILYDVEIKVPLLTIIFYFCAFLLVKVIDKDKFLESFIQCVLLIAIFSDIAYLIAIKDFSILSGLPQLVNSSNRVGYFGVFFIASDFSQAGAMRNQGIFWEPGAFQFILVLCYIFELYNKKHAPRLGILLILLVTLVTTISTTGIFATIALLVFSLYKGYFIKAKWLIIPLLGGLTYCVIYIFSNAEGFLYFTLLGKLDQVINYQVGDDTDASSRVDSIIFPLRLFVSSPIWGIGSGGLSTLKNITCTPVNIIVQYGVFYAILVFSALFNFLKGLTYKYSDSIILFILLCFSSSTEAFETNVLFLMIIFWGIFSNSSRQKCQIYENCCY